MRVAVVGAGSISREFATRHFGPGTGTFVSCVVDVCEERARQLAADVGSVQAGAAVVGDNKYRSRPMQSLGSPVPHFSELCRAALESCDCVYVGTTPASHAGLVRQALTAGKHVILEKPIAASAKDADEIVELAETALNTKGLHTSMDIGMRWNSALTVMRAELARGRIGKLRKGWLRLHFQAWPREWQVQDWCAGRKEGGPLREVGTHFIFGLLDLFGHDCVQRVCANVTYPDGPDGTLAEQSVDGVLELMETTSGQKNPLQISLSVRTKGESGRQDLCELEVCGEGGSLRLFDFTSLADGRGKVIVDRAPYGRRECVTELVRAAQWQSAGTRQSAGTSGTSMVSAREARNAQRVLDAVLSSRGEWVAVSCAAPVQSYAAPVQQTYAAPVQQSYAAPMQSYAAPAQTYAAPVQSYAAPAQTYAAPMQQSYAAPMQTYVGPAQTYAAPAQTYAAPASYAPTASYGAPSYGVPSYGAPSYGTPMGGYGRRY